jgi:hypothetical protein
MVPNNVVHGHWWLASLIIFDALEVSVQLWLRLTAFPGRLKMKYMVSALAFICIASFAHADRGLFTSECVESATLIGVWGPRDIVKSEKGIQLKKPHLLLKGDADILGSVTQYSSRLTTAIELIEQNPLSPVRNRSLILFLTVKSGNADLVEFEVRYSDIALRGIQTVITQLELKEKWKMLSINDQIEQSDLIVSGKIVTDEARCPMRFHIVVDKKYRGVPLPQFEVLPISHGPIDVESLYFIQRHCGDGANFIVMNAVPLKDATKYLERLKETSGAESGTECDSCALESSCHLTTSSRVRLISTPD